MKHMDRSKIGWTLVALGAGYLATRALDGASRAGWRALTGEEPPVEAGSLDTPWREAIAWTAATSLTLGVGRLLSQRLAAAGWQRLLGSPPPL